MSLKNISMVLSVILLMGCSSANSGKVVRIPTTDIVDSDATYGVEDLNIFVNKMVKSMLQSSISQKKPSIAFGEIGIGSGVYEHIDVKLISNKIRTNILKSEEVEIKNSTTFENVDYKLTGDIHAIKKDNRKGVDNFYMLNLILTNVKTSTVVWSEDAEVRKLVKR